MCVCVCVCVGGGGGGGGGGLHGSMGVSRLAHLKLEYVHVWKEGDEIEDLLYLPGNIICTL